MKKIGRNIANMTIAVLYWGTEAIGWIIAVPFDIIDVVVRTIKYGALKMLSSVRRGENPLGCRGYEWNRLIDSAKTYHEEMACKLDNLRVK